jgi:hypothetical protein
MNKIYALYLVTSLHNISVIVLIVSLILMAVFNIASLESKNRLYIYNDLFFLIICIATIAACVFPPYSVMVKIL